MVLKDASSKGGGEMLKLKGAGTVLGIILISVCGWVAIIGLVIKPGILVGSALSVVGGMAIGAAVAYLMWRWWFKKERRL